MFRKLAAIGILTPFLISRAQAARRAGRFREAALLYEEAIRLRPGRARLHIQAGHMRKESGAFATADAHYRAALRAMPDDGDLALQLGHFYKVAGRPVDAEAEYLRASRLDPGATATAAEAELKALRAGDWFVRAGIEIAPAAQLDGLPGDAARLGARATELLDARVVGRLAPDLVPRHPGAMLRTYHEAIEVHRLGSREAGFWGKRRTLRGVEAVRGFCVSAVPIGEVRVIVNGLAIHRSAPKGPYPLRLAREDDPHRKYVFNIWMDFSGFAFGLHNVELQFLRRDGETRSFHEQVVVAEPLAEADHPASDALVSIDPDDDRSIERQVRDRPSMVRPARRDVFPDGVRNILVLRTDQLGDMIASIPAMKRLRVLVPDARIVGLLTAANTDFARSLALFDEIITIDFPDDPVERRRLMPLDAQEALRERLAPYDFDIAMDLAQSNVSRDLLPLSGARFLYGVGGEDWPWLTTEFVFNSHDRWSRMDVVPHSAKILAMIEALGAILRTSAPIIRRPDLSRDMLASYGIAPDRRYIVLHMGARVVFSRWPHYAALARLLLRDTDLTIVMMTEDPLVRATIPEDLLADARLLYLDSRLPFDHFDAFVSYATVLVGNDSGPKHLASLRGTNVVTLFTARINWAEWGQENVGSIVSRKVPCQGCMIFHDLEDCGQGFTCIADIKPREVLDAVMRYV